MKWVDSNVHAVSDDPSGPTWITVDCSEKWVSSSLQGWHWERACCSVWSRCWCSTWGSLWLDSILVSSREWWPWLPLNSSGGSPPLCGPVLPCCSAPAFWPPFSIYTGRKVSRGGSPNSVCASSLTHPRDGDIILSDDSYHYLNQTVSRDSRRRRIPLEVGFMRCSSMCFT